MADKISVEIGLEGGDDVRKTLEEIVGGVDGLKSAAEELGQTDVTLAVKAEGTAEAKTGIDGVKTAAEDLGQTDAAVNVKAEGADEAKTGIDGVKTAAEGLDQTDPTINVRVEGADEAKTKIDEIKGAAEGLGQTDATVNVSAEGAAETKSALDTVSQTATVVSGSIDTLGLAFTRMGARLTKSLGPLGILARSFGPVGIAVGVLAGTITKFGDSAADALNKLAVESAKLGLTEQELDKLQQAFGKLGVAPDALASSLEKLKPLLGGGLMRVGDIVPPSALAGIQQFIAKLESMPDGIARTKLAIDTLGDALGGQVIAGLRTGTISAQNFKSALDSITPATQQQRADAASYQQSLNALNMAWKTFKDTVGTPLSTSVFQILTGQLEGITRSINQLKADWGAFKATLEAPFAFGSLEKIYNLVVTIGSALGWVTPAGLAAKGMGTAFGEAAQGITQSEAALKKIQAQAGQTGQAAAQAGQQAAQGVKVWNEELGRAVPAADKAGKAATQAGQQTSQAGQQGASAWQTLTAEVDKATTSVTNFISRMASIVWDTISGLGVSAWNALIGAIQTAIDKLLQFLGLREGRTQVVGGPVGSGGIGGKARGGLLGGRGTGTSDSNLAWVSRGEHIMPASVVRQPGVLAFLEALRRGGGIPGFQGGGLMLGGDFMGPVENFMAELKKSIEGIEAMMAAALMQAARSLNFGSHASGGLIGGRGTGTSDSNLAWLSRGEYVTPAHAVRQPGMLAFLEALRRSGGDLSRVLDGMGRFALGGMVPRAIPAFAGGGIAGGGNNVTIQFPGLPAIGGLRASSDVVDQLQKAAALAQVRSGGRKPSRYS